jgi:hypothetical protein
MVAIVPWFVEVFAKDLQTKPLTPDFDCLLCADSLLFPVFRLKQSFRTVRQFAPAIHLVPAGHALPGASLLLKTLSPALVCAHFAWGIDRR